MRSFVDISAIAWLTGLGLFIAMVTSMMTIFALEALCTAYRRPLYASMYLEGSGAPIASSDLFTHPINCVPIIEVTGESEQARTDRDRSWPAAMVVGNRLMQV